MIVNSITDVKSAMDYVESAIDNFDGSYEVDIVEYSQDDFNKDFATIKKAFKNLQELFESFSTDIKELVE